MSNDEGLRKFADFCRDCDGCCGAPGNNKPLRRETERDYHGGGLRYDV